MLLLATACGGHGASLVPAERKTIVIASALPASGYYGDRTAVMRAAIQAAINARHGEAGPYRVKYLPLDSGDHSSDYEGDESPSSCAAAADRATHDHRVMAVIGPMSNGGFIGPGCAETMISALAQAGIALIAPATAAVADLPPGLTHAVRSGIGEGCRSPCAPAPLYPTGVRNFFRIAPADDSEGVAAAKLLARLGVRRAYLLSEGTDLDPAWMADAFLTAAKAAGVRVVGRGLYSTYRLAAEPIVHRRDLPLLTRKVVASGAQGLYLLDDTTSAGLPSSAFAVKVYDAVRRAGFRGPIVGSLTLTDPNVVRKHSHAMNGVYLLSSIEPYAALGARAKRLSRRVAAMTPLQEHLGRPDLLDPAYAAEAANVALDAIARSDGTRSGVRQALFELNRRGLLGPLSFDANGDPQPQRVAVFRVEHGMVGYRRLITLPRGP
jgi:branched-chain amino acid transport system substrate-binding protein